MRLIDISTPKFPNTFAMVDDEDFDFLNQWKWHPHKDHKWIYATRKKHKENFQIHRFILNASLNMLVDHLDGNGLNNQKENLRVCTKQQNCFNKKKMERANGSIYKGVYKIRNKFISQIGFNYKTIVIGKFDTEIQAALAYNEAAKIYHGDFARLNKIS